jgi:CDGSH-type Zn-finger protein
MLVEGPVRIETPDGAVVESDRFMVAICTCHRSKEYPLCDTSHRRRARAPRGQKDRLRKDSAPDDQAAIS